MNKTDFMIMVAKNIHDMQELKLKYKYSYNHYDRSQFYDIARKINRYSKVDVPESKTPIDERKINEYFLLSLEKLDNDYIYDYFQRILKGIKIEKKKCIYSDEAELEYEIAKNQPTKFLIYLPKTKLTITNQIGFAHEMGHIPEIDVPRNTFFEYNETIPMFLNTFLLLIVMEKKMGEIIFYAKDYQ